jgi:phosphocarrier protein HPr
MDTDQRLSAVLQIINLRGLHARASAKVVRCAAKYPLAEVTVSKDGATVCALSVMGLMALSASCGTSVEVSAANNEQGEAAIRELRELTENKFDEE